MADHPGAELDDEPGPLGNGDEALGADEADAGALPAHEGLAGDDLPVAEPDDRLVDEAQLPEAQATHHACHRPVWADRAATIKAFLDSLGPGRRTEKARLQADYERARLVVAEIDARTTPPTPEH